MLTAEEMRRLATQEFTDFVRQDAVMREIQQEAARDPAEVLNLWEMLGVAAYRIGSLPVRPLTAAKWALYWSLHIASADLFLGILAEPDLRKLDCEIASLPAKYSGYAAATGLSPEEVKAEIRRIENLAFLPLARLPRDPGSSGDPEFDAVWLAGITAIAAKEANITAEAAAHDLPLSAVCAFFTAWARRESSHPERIRRQPSAAVQQKIDRRFEELQNEFLKGKRDADSLQNHVGCGGVQA